MSEYSLKNSFIGLSEENGKFYIETIDLNSNNDKKLLNEFLNEKNITNPLNKQKYIGFCFDCQKNINEYNNKCIKHTVEYYKDIIQNINIEQIKYNYNIALNNFTYILKIIEEKIENFKKRNNEQLMLAMRIIDIFQKALNDNDLTYQIISNVKNFTHFNYFDIYSLNKIFNDNILNQFSIDNFVNKNFSIEKIQKNTEIKFKEPIRSILFLDKINKIILDTPFQLILFNLKDYAYENKIFFPIPILSLNQMKDDITIYIVQSNSIQRLRVIDNFMIIDQLFTDISIYFPNIVINYKNSIAWTNGMFIGFWPQNYYNISDALKIDPEAYSGSYNFQVTSLFEYQNNSILFIFLFNSFDHHGYKYCSINLGIYNNQLNMQKKNNYIYLHSINNDDYCDEYEINDNVDLKDLKNYQIFDFKPNKVIIFGETSIFVIDIPKWKIINNILISDCFSINKAFSMNNNCFVILLSKLNIKYIKELHKILDEFINKIFIIKIEESSHKIILQKNFILPSDQYLIHYQSIHLDYPLHRIFSFNSENIVLYEIINMKINKSLSINIKE